MTENLKNKAFRATVWVIGGYGIAQILRLGGNLILTRILVPELFGIMAIAQVFMLGLGLFTDIGLAPGVIRSKRSDDPAFLNTAWTLQVIRGAILLLLTFAIAHPVAKMYNNPLLAWILPVLGLGSLFMSFSSTSIYTLNRKVQLGKITAMELTAKFIGLVCMVVLAYLYRSVWALVASSLVVTAVTAIWSHFLDPTIRNRFSMEKAAVNELISFGKWIFVSTAMMFLATQADRLLLGKFFPLAMLGIYSIAVIFAELPKMVIAQLSSRVIFPLMSHFSDLPRQEFRAKILQKRKLFLFPLTLLIALYVSFGDVLITKLYDERYHQAGWMLPLLALGMWPYILYASIDRCFYAIGLPKIPAVGNFLKFLYMIICVPLMFRFAGTFGAVLAVAINDLPVYLVISYGLKKERLTCFKQDFLATLLLVSLIAIFVTIRLTFDAGFPGIDLLEQ